MAEARPLVVLLRGINVGRSNRLAMADFHAVLTGVGGHDVQTILQSGNAVMRGADGVGSYETAIHDALRARGVTVAVLVREATDLAAALDDDPLAELADDPARHLIGFLAEPATPASRARLIAELQRAQDSAPDRGDRFAVVGDHVFLWCPQGVSRSPFGTAPWADRAKTVVTMRNERTVRSLIYRAGH